MKVKKTSVLKLDENQTFLVEELPSEIQQLVEVYDQFRQQSEDARLEHVSRNLAVEGVKTQLASAVKKYVDETRTQQSDDLPPENNELEMHSDSEGEK